jgi:hypothetical protein
LWTFKLERRVKQRRVDFGEWGMISLKGERVALALSMIEIDDDEGRTWHPRKKNDGIRGGCTALLEARWSLRAKARRRKEERDAGGVIAMNA